MPKPTMKQKIIAARRVRRKYPRMSDKDWGKEKDKPNWAQRLKGKVRKFLKTTGRTKVIKKDLKKAGVSRKEVKKLRGKY